MHQAIFKNREAFDVLVDAVHELMRLEDWDNAKTLNHLRLQAINVPNKEIESYFEAIEFMNSLSYMNEYIIKLQSLVNVEETIDDKKKNC